MIKLPINLLLYALILGLLAGSGYQFFLAVNDDYALDQQGSRKVFEDRLKAGADRFGEDGTGPNYRDESGLWEKFATANFTGKEPPAPPNTRTALQVDCCRTYRTTYAKPKAAEKTERPLNPLAVPVPARAINSPWTGPTRGSFCRRAVMARPRSSSR